MYCYVCIYGHPVCTDLFNHEETPLVSTAMHWITEIADTVPEIDRNEKKPTKKLLLKLTK